MIKIGVIGVGHLGSIHLSLLKERNEFEVIGFFDTDAERAEQVGRTFSIKHYAHYTDLLKVCDAIDIVCPTPFHFEYAQQAIKEGKHLFIEKPATLHPKETKQLEQLANEAGIIAQVGHVEQFNPAWLAAKPHFANPIFIHAERSALYNPRGTDVSVVLDLMIHDIDLVLSIVKSNVKKVQAQGISVLCSTHDIAHARIDFDNGAVANLSASRVAMENKRRVHVLQEESVIDIDLLNKSAQKASFFEPLSPQESGKIIADREEKKIIQTSLTIKPVNAISHELELFARAIKSRINPEVSLSEAYLTMRTAQQIIECCHA
ncbi:MAG: Gfo/Idh/MocA family oxidoreductase [Bacteroidetes bacterium]|nr:Gfo/Idh/MocA family oxidoreductase [Bacteroidota bacterium]